MVQLDEQWIKSATARELLAGYARILRQLRERGIVRSGNAPVGDYAELLVAEALHGEMAENFSVKSYDVRCDDFGQVQVKARLASNPPKAGQMHTSPFRSWDFDHAAFVLFDSDTYEVRQAALLPSEAVKVLASHRPHVNGYIVRMNAPLFGHPDAVDIAEQLRSAGSGLG